MQGADRVARLHCRLRELRLQRGLSQAALAAAAGVARQTVAGIERGTYGATAAVALRLAGALGVRVEDIFALEGEPPVVAARWACRALRASSPAAGADDPLAAAAGARVRLAAVPAGWLAWPVPASATGLHAADGIVLGDDRDASGCRARLLGPRALVAATAVIAGCEPALELLAQRVAGRPWPARALWWNLPNAAAVAAVGAGAAHVAAVHGLEREGGAPDPALPVPPPGLRIFHLLRAREGWIFRPDTPLGDPQDLASGRLRLINRPTGSGARWLLEAVVRRVGIRPEGIPGYDEVALGHWALAARIAARQADVGIGAESAALAFGLGFVPLREERCELWVPAEHCELPPVKELLEVLSDDGFRADLAAAAPYDTRDTGRERTARELPLRRHR